MIVSMSGAVYAWGKNSRGQLGLGDTQVNHLVFQKCYQSNLVLLNSWVTTQFWISGIYFWVAKTCVLALWLKYMLRAIGLINFVSHITS